MRCPTCGDDAKELIVDFYEIKGEAPKGYVSCLKCNDDVADKAYLNADVIWIGSKKACWHGTIKAYGLEIKV